MLAGGLMHHDWVFDVLQDMLSYATLNGLPRLAERVAEALEVAREEIGSPGGPDDPAGNPPETPPSGDRKMH
jgi:hypothetical protein